MAKRALTDRALKSLKPAPAGQRYEVMDTIVPGLGARVTSNGTITMMLLARYPGSSNPTRRALGKYSPLRDADRKAAEKDYDALPAEQREHLTLDQYLLRTYGPTTLAGARSRARQWKEMIRRGKDPAIEEERARDTEARKRANAFAAVAEDFIAEKLPGERKGKEVERDIRREFIPPWGKRPITELTRRDIRDIIDAKKQIAPAQARNLLGLAKRLFAWAVDQDRYGLEASPADTLKPTKIIGDKVAGKRILDDAELFALWRAAKRTPYPVGPIYQLLILSALRLNEVADASWPEVKLRDRMWTIPPERMKGKNGKALPHVVPLTDEILTVLNALPRFRNGDYLFSTFGAKPVWIGDRVKKRIEARMLHTLRALARRRGEDPSRVVLPHWTNHDIRRTVRSNLSRLKVAEEAREAVLAHVRPGIKGTYDLHDYYDEKREALTLWAARLREITEPPPTNVLPFTAASS